MTAELTSLEGCRRKLHVELPAEDVVAAYKRVLRDYQTHAELPGFRKGKAPVSTIERRFGANIAQDVNQFLTGKAWRDAIKEKEIKAVEIVDVDNVNVSKTEGFSADYTLDVAPEFELPDYAAIPVTFEKAAVSDADVDNQLESFRRSSSTYKDAEPDHAIVDGDLVQGSLVASADGGPIDELVGEEHKSLAATDTAWCRAGADYGAIPGFGKAVLGLKVGDAVEFDTVFASDYYVEALRDKSVHYKGTINKVSTTVLPEVDEAFCKRFGADDADSLKAAIRARLEEQAAAANESRKSEAICQYLLANTTLDAPKSSIDQEARAIVQEMVSGGLRQGVEKDDILKDKDKILENAEKLAADRVRVGWILGKIADAEKITASQGEIRARISEIAERRQSTYEKTLSDLEKRGAIEGITSAIVNEKALAWLRERAKEG